MQRHPRRTSKIVDFMTGLDLHDCMNVCTVYPTLIVFSSRVRLRGGGGGTNILTPHRSRKNIFNWELSRPICIIKKSLTFYITTNSLISAKLLRGFVKFKKIKKSEKNSEVGGWVKSQLGFFFFRNCVFFVLFSCFQMFPWWVCGCKAPILNSLYFPLCSCKTYILNPLYFTLCSCKTYILNPLYFTLCSCKTYILYPLYFTLSSCKTFKYTSKKHQKVDFLL